MINRGATNGSYGTSLFQDKHEIDRMTLTMNVELPDSFSPELRHLLDGLLHRDIEKRLGG